MEGKELVVRGDKELALQELETHFAMATRQRQLLEDYIKERLKPGRHFYKVSAGQKDSLTKEGAELVCLAHALRGRYDVLSGPENPPLDDTPYQITVKCGFEASGKFAGEGIGSASSHVTTRDGEHKPRQKDPGLRHNATLKMACKSAYIAATLNSTAASEFFTQDLEDDHTGDFEQSEGKGHWCSVHKTAFFKKGKMKRYAHPVKGTDPVKWCNEKEDKPEPVESSEYPEESTAMLVKDLEKWQGGGKVELPQMFESFGQVAGAAMNIGVSGPEVFAKAGVEKWTDFTSFGEAWDVVCAVREEKEAGKPQQAKMGG